MPKPIVCLSEQLSQYLEAFRGCFSKRQWKYFVTVLLGLIECEECKTMTGMLRVVGEEISLSGLSRFLNKWSWSLSAVVTVWQERFGQRVEPLVQNEHERLKAEQPKHRGRPKKTVVTGTLIFDDSVHTKPKGRSMGGLGKHYANTEKSVVSGHCLLTGLYVLLGQRCPLQPQLYRQKAVCEQEGVIFQSKIDMVVSEIEDFTPTPRTHTHFYALRSRLSWVVLTGASGHWMQQSTLIDLPYRSHLAQARLKEFEGDLEAALELLDEAKRLYIETSIPNARPVEALKARIFLKQGQRSKAGDRVCEQGLSVYDEISYLSEFEHITLVRVIIAEYRSNQEKHFLSDALRLLERLLKAAEDGYRMGSVIQILIEQALVYEAQGDISSALVPLKRVLKLAAPEEYLRIFVDEGPPMAGLLYQSLSDGVESMYIHRLLAAFPDVEVEKTRSPKSQADLIEPLSERELEVLQLIAEGLTNQEIADRLYLWLHTVKIHAGNVYAKLGVKNRTQAALYG